MDSGREAFFPSPRELVQNAPRGKALQHARCPPYCKIHAEQAQWVIPDMLSEMFLVAWRWGCLQHFGSSPKHQFLGSLSVFISHSQYSALAAAPRDGIWCIVCYFMYRSGSIADALRGFAESRGQF
jgi:hypothetical protein